MTCKQCGMKFEEQAVFCPACGANREAAEKWYEATAEKPENEKARIAKDVAGTAIELAAIIADFVD